MILSRNSQGKGYGKQLLQKVQQEKNTLYGWVVVESDYIRNDGLPYPSPLNFYLKMGFQLMNEKWETTTLKMERIVWSRV
jgi:GNAT superfamily N-acetyltransferase